MEGVIADGDVDTRSILDVPPHDLAGYDQCHFFAGIGVWSHALRSAGWPDGKAVWTGSCPCQPFSAAGEGGGFADERHLWPAWYHLIELCKPRVIFGEQVASKDGLNWLDLVQTDLENAGYANAAVDLCAAGVGAPHMRQRLYFVADSDYAGLERRQGETPIHKPYSESAWARSVVVRDSRDDARRVEPGTFPLAYGVANRVGRLRAYGNAIVAPCAEEFIRAYTG
jgi:DNA (cytosine-5)-methyltransferase 1